MTSMRPDNLKTGQGMVRNHLRGMEMVLKQADDRYAITPEVRQQMLDEALALATRSNSERVRVAALRVLAMLDQVNVRRERNEIAEEGTALAASTARLRVALGSQEGREALAAVTSAVCGPAKTPMNPPVLDDGPTKEHADASVSSPEVNGAETGDYASFGGPRYRKENVTGELPKPQ